MTYLMIDIFPNDYIGKSRRTETRYSFSQIQHELVDIWKFKKMYNIFDIYGNKFSKQCTKKLVKGSFVAS